MSYSSLSHFVLEWWGVVERGEEYFSKSCGEVVLEAARHQFGIENPVMPS